MFLKKQDFDNIRNIAKSFNNLYVTPETLVYYLLTHKHYGSMFATFNDPNSITTITSKLREFMSNNTHSKDDVEPRVSYTFEVLIKRSL
jgi:hypothetical protein